MKNAEKWYSDFGEYTIDEYVKERILNNPEEMERFAQIIKHVPKETETVLDVGCGPGVFLHLLERNRNIRGIGIEISDNKVNYAERHLRVHAEKGDAGNLRFEDRAFDVVTALEVIEHLPYGTYEQALEEMARVAKKTIIIGVPYNEERSFMTCPYCQTKFNASYHLRSFREDMLGDLFPGFAIDKVEKIGMGQAWPTFLQKAYNIRNKKCALTEFVCPACGYGKPPQKTNGSKQEQNEISLEIKTLLRFFLKIVPKKKKARWLLVVYNRKR